MSLVVMVLLGLLAAAGALVGPVAVAELPQGRESFQRTALEGATEAGLVQALSGPWVLGVRGSPPGTVVPIPSVRTGARLVITLEAEALAGDWWLVHGRGVLLDQAGDSIGARRAGWMVQVGVFPPDTLVRARLTSRPWVAGFE
jgi:hypothetical protein